MPFKSEAQRRWMYAAEARGEVPKGTAARWEKETSAKDLPEHVADQKKESVDLSMLQALIDAGQHYGPMAAQQVGEFAHAHPLAFGAGTGAAGYAGGRVHQALRDFGKNIALGGRQIGAGVRGAGQAVGQGLKDVSTNAALGAAAAGQNVGKGVAGAARALSKRQRQKEISLAISRVLNKTALDESEVYSGPPAFAPEEPPPVSTTEAAKNLTERRDEHRSDNRDAPSALPILGAKEAMYKLSSDKPWEKEAPEGKKKSTLTDAQKDAARRRAAEAGRKYPNLIDNMWAASRGSKKESAEKIAKPINLMPTADEAVEMLYLHGIPSVSASLSGALADDDKRFRDMMATGIGSYAGGVLGGVAGGGLGHLLGSQFPSKTFSGARSTAGPLGMVLGALAGHPAGQIGGALLGRYLARRGDNKDESIDLGEEPAKTGAEDALILLGLPAAWADKSAGEAWQRAEGKNPEGGLNAKGRASLRAKGHNIKPPVSSEQAKKSPKAAARRKSFCARMGGMPGPMKKDNGEPTRKALALRKWDC